MKKLYNISECGISDNMPRRRLRDLNVIQIPPNSEETNSDQQTAIGSSNVPNTVDDPVEIQSNVNFNLHDLYNLNSVECVKVSRNSHGQSIGSEARVLAGYLGIIARNVNLLPINYESCHHMPDSNKNHTLDNIKVITFVLEVSNNYVKKALAKKWRDHKCTLKKEYFKKNISLEEKLRNVPLGMLRIVSELELQVGKNKNSRIQLGQKELSSGQKVGLLQLFDITHRKKYRSPMTVEATEIMEKLKNKRAEYETTASNDSSVNLDNIDNQVITVVLGPKRSSSQQYMPSANQAQAEVQRLRDQMAQMQTSTVQKIAQLKVAVASREAEAKRKYNEL
ncbi:hypothetical protein PVK06_028213 [Gossypium arboreum]|uniref:Uncharacterized protein n=1 Tax=Gossypium arboreum TaxID=29729 RepID=A0ABR0P3Q9_GOSAR|nr:hypothetical protein PVK06_028213 [Gossypium arboreum]